MGILSSFEKNEIMHSSNEWLGKLWTAFSFVTYNFNCADLIRTTLINFIIQLELVFRSKDLK